MIKFSVIVPLYNCEKYISECVDSILKQDYPHFEIVVVNDGSTDNSRNIVDSYSDDRIRIIDKENGGLLHARLTGIKEAANEHIVFVDADDRIRSTLLSDLSKQFENGADVVVYKLIPFSEKGYSSEPAGIYSHNAEFSADDRKTLLKKLLTTGEINSIVCKAFKKKLLSIDEMEAYPRIAIGEDALFTLQLFTKYQKLVYLNRVYYDYRQFGESMTHKLKNSNYTDNLFRFDLYYEVAKEYFDNDEDVVPDIDRLFFKMTISCTVNPKLRAESKEQYTEFIELVRASELFSKKINDAYKKQPLLNKFVLKSIEKNRVGKLLFIRRLFEFVPR